MSKDFDYMFKVILIGSSAVGKSNILLRFTRDQFNEQHQMTIGVEYAAKNVQPTNKIIRLQIWDTLGQQQYKAIMKTFYKGASAVILTYDITSEKSFNDLDYWYNQIKEFSKNQIVIMLVGNKSDLEDERKISKQKGLQYAEKHKIAFYQVSAKDGTNIELIFGKIAECTSLIIGRATKNNVRNLKSQKIINNRQWTIKKHRFSCQQKYRALESKQQSSFSTREQKMLQMISIILMYSLTLQIYQQYKIKYQSAKQCLILAASIQYKHKVMDGVEAILYPRYLPKMLPKEGKPVCVAGQVLDISENNALTLQCDAESKQQLIIEVPNHIDIAPLKGTKYIEVRGVCGENGDILMREYTDLKESFDLKTYNEIVGLAYREFKDIFNYSQ